MVALAVALHQKSHLILPIAKRSPAPKGGKLRLRILVETVVVVAAFVVAWVMVVVVVEAVVVEVVVVLAVVVVAELVVTVVGGVAVDTVEVGEVAGMKMILLQSLLGMFEIAHTQQC